MPVGQEKEPEKATTRQVLPGGIHTYHTPPHRRLPRTTLGIPTTYHARPLPPHAPLLLRHSKQRCLRPCGAAAFGGTLPATAARPAAYSHAACDLYRKLPFLPAFSTSRAWLPAATLCLLRRVGRRMRLPTPPAAPQALFSPAFAAAASMYWAKSSKAGLAAHIQCHTYRSLWDCTTGIACVPLGAAAPACLQASDSSWN